MKIRANDPVAQLKSVLERTQEKIRPARTEASPQGADRVEVSSTAREFAALREAALGAPEVRRTLVESLRQKIESGAYEPEARAVAARMLEELGVGLDE